MERQLEMRYATANAPGIWTYEIVLEPPAHHKCNFDCYMQHVGTPCMCNRQLGMLYTIANTPGISTSKLLLEPPIHKTIQLWLLYTALWCLQPLNNMILKTKCNAFSTSTRQCSMLCTHSEQATGSSSSGSFSSNSRSKSSS